MLRLCALTDRGQKCTAEQKRALRDVIRQLEEHAPATDASALNGEWRLLAACGESTYRSSPFFWAFRQATSGLSTPISIPSADVPAGGSFASAVYGITDAIPFYDVGPVVQRFRGICSATAGCDVPADADGEGKSEAEPSEGSSVPLTPVPATFESEVELKIGRLFGLPAASSLMTTSGSVIEEVDSDAEAVVEVVLRVERTAARQSTIAQLLPAIDDLLAFPTGDALDAMSASSSRVLLRTTYLSPQLRISRPVLSLSSSSSAGRSSECVFVYARSG